MKKVLFSILGCIIISISVFTLNTSAAINTTALYGDVNEDNRIEIDDVTWIQRYAALMIDFNGLQKESADYDHNGAVTITDATLIQRKLINLYVPENCGGWFDCYSSAKLIFADYVSGKAMVGVPVTFTMQGGCPYGKYEPDDFYKPITYSVEIYDTALSWNEPVETYCGYENTITYTFERSGNYKVVCSISDRFDNESYYDYNYTVVEPYSLENPVITSTYTDKGRRYEAIYAKEFVPSCNWQDTTFFAVAKGGSGVYQYSFELHAGEEILYKDYSPDNSFTVDSRFFPGRAEYQKDRFHYVWREVEPYELTVRVKDSDGNEASETCRIAAIDDFDTIG